MLAKLQHGWHCLRSSFWFVPAGIVVGAISLASSLIAIETILDLSVLDRWPLLFGAGAEGARGLLATVASSMITVAGVVFSITIVALSLTSSQYTSRVLRNFMRDRMNQTVLGVFVGIFAYCLVVLRTVRGASEEEFVPSLAVLGGLILALVGIGFLIFFIHYISVSIQAASVVGNASRETLAAIDHLFPEGVGDEPNDDADAPLGEADDEYVWSIVRSTATGYIATVDGEELLAFAREHSAVLRMERGVGEFVVDGAPLVSVASSDDRELDATKRLNAQFVISRHRTVEQDASFGVRQIVDIALKALSPGVNDTTTAVMCVDYLAAILVRLAKRRIASARRVEDGQLRLIARGPSFETLLAEAFDQIRQNANANVAILTRMLQALETIAEQTRPLSRRKALRQHAELVLEVAERTIPSSHDRAEVAIIFTRLAQSLDRPFVAAAGTENS